MITPDAIRRKLASSKPVTCIFCMGTGQCMTGECDGTMNGPGLPDLCAMAIELAEAYLAEVERAEKAEHLVGFWEMQMGAACPSVDAMRDFQRDLCPDLPGSTQRIDKVIEAVTDLRRGDHQKAIDHWRKLIAERMRDDADFMEMGDEARKHLIRWSKRIEVKHE